MKCEGLSPAEKQILPSANPPGVPSPLLCPQVLHLTFHFYSYLLICPYACLWPAAYHPPRRLCNEVNSPLRVDSCFIAAEGGLTRPMRRSGEWLTADGDSSRDDDRWYANAGYACTAGPSSITFSFFFTLSASFSYSPLMPPAEQAVEKRRPVCSQPCQSSNPQVNTHPASALKPSANKPHARTLFWTFSYSCNHLCVFWVCCLSFLNTHRRILYLILIYGLAELLLKFPSPHSPGLISRPYRKKIKPSCAPWEGNYSTLYLDKNKRQ